MSEHLFDLFRLELLADFDPEYLVDKFYSLIHPIPDYLFYCTCRASRSVLGSRHPNPQLQTVAQYCGYDLTYHHHALTDAEACTWIALEILDF